MSSRLSKFLRIAPREHLRPSTVERLSAFEGFEAVGEESVSVEHTAEISIHDEAVFLLHVAAEIEHALMVQYLYAAYSLGGSQIPEDKKELVDDWKKIMFSVAKEEMGHLASVQNLLHLIGGPLNFEREDFPFRSDIYPFRFKLEPLTKNSLAKYVFAEMPSDLSGDDIDEIRERAMGANMNDPVNHVGKLFEAIAGLFNQKNPDGTYNLTELFEDSENYQAGDSWKGENFVLNKVKNRQEAITLIENIAKQGEGLEVKHIQTPGANLMESAVMQDSHYVRLRSIYDDFPETGDWEPSIKIATNPNTNYVISEESSDGRDNLEKELKQGRITNPETMLWAQLLNTRYRRLLTAISHALYLDSGNSSEAKRREILRSWVFQEMLINIKRLSGFLISLPVHDAPAESIIFAGPPFELPYSLDLPALERNRWILQRDIIMASQMLTARILKETTPTDDQRDYLIGLAKSDEKDLKTAKDPDKPMEEPDMKRFSEVKSILEDAVGNVAIGAHENFWRDKTRDQFIDFQVFGQILIAKKDDGTFDENESNLIKALEGRTPFGSDIGTLNANLRRMPAGRSPVPQEKIDIIRKWIGDGCPDDDDDSTNGEDTTALSFETDIKGLFRETPDRSVMLAIAQFDLHKFEDVTNRADQILARLEDGSMPCDGKWSDDLISTFKKWIDDGKKP